MSGDGAFCLNVEEDENVKKGSTSPTTTVRDLKLL